MKTHAVVEYWRESAESDYHTAVSMWKTKHYDWCLFIWHLVIEKALKARIVEKHSTVPLTHDLVRLAKQAGITLDDAYFAQLSEIKSFNLEARYDDYKFSFHKKATAEYCKKWMAICKKIYTDLLKNA